MSEGVLSVCWKDHPNELATVYKSLLENKFFVDCTISAEGQSLKAHRLVLSACSPYFHMLFREETGKHPFIILLDASFETLRAVIDFVYRGETQIPEGNFNAFLTLAQSLQIKGLDAFSKDYRNNQSSGIVGNVLQGSGPFADKQHINDIQSSRASHENSKNYPQQRPHHLESCADAEDTSFSVPLEGCSASHEEVRSRQEYQSRLGSGEVHVSCEITAKDEPLDAEVLEAGNEIVLDNISRNDLMTGSFKSEMDNGNVSICTDHRLNQFSSCNESSRENGESSVMSSSELQRRQLRDEVLSERDAAEQSECSLPAIIVPKREYLDDEPMADPDGNGTDEGSQHAHEPSVGCAGGTSSEDGFATQQQTSMQLWSGESLESNPDPSQRGLQPNDWGREESLSPAGHTRSASSSDPAAQNRALAGKSHTCDICGISCRTPSRLVVHRRTHTGERPYRCHECGKSFARSDHLNVHRRTHTGERPYHCEVCGKAFTLSHHIANHMQTHTGERPYSCDVCGKAFTQAHHVATHKQTHTGERPYSCDVCGKGFSRTTHLNVHMRTHVNV